MVFPLPAPQMSPTYLRADPVTVLCTLNSHPRYERPPCWSAPHTGKCCRRSQSDHPKEGVNQWLGPVYSGHQVNQRFHWLQIFGPKSLNEGPNFFSNRRMSSELYMGCQEQSVNVENTGGMLSVWEFEPLLLHVSQNQEPTVSVVIHQYSIIWWYLMNPGSVFGKSRHSTCFPEQNRPPFFHVCERRKSAWPWSGLRFPWPRTTRCLVQQLGVFRWGHSHSARRDLPHVPAWDLPLAKVG